MGRRPAAKTVRRTPHIRRRRVDEDERTLSQRIRRVDDVGFESESEQDARDAKFKRYPKGWKGTKEEVDLEYEKHKEIGRRRGAGKAGPWWKTTMGAWRNC